MSEQKLSREESFALERENTIGPARDHLDMSTIQAMLMDQNDLELVETDEETVNEISRMNTSADEMTRYLSSLSPEQMSVVKNESDALMELFSTMLASAVLPQKPFAAKIRNGTVVGYVTVKGYGQPDPEIQIEVVPAYQRQGYGHEILRRILLQMFRETDAKTVLYYIRPDNTPSIRLVESCGGILRQPRSKAEAILLKTYMIQEGAFVQACGLHKDEGDCHDPLRHKRNL